MLESPKDVYFTPQQAHDYGLITKIEELKINGPAYQVTEAESTAWVIRENVEKMAIQ